MCVGGEGGGVNVELFVHVYETLLLIKSEQFLDKMSEYKLLKKISEALRQFVVWLITIFRITFILP